MTFQIKLHPVWSSLRRQRYSSVNIKCVVVLLSIGPLLSLFTPASAQNSNLTWQRLSGAAIDLAIGHQGQMWAIGTDGFAYRWNASRKTWVRYGQRKDFTRIDGEAGGGAIAVTSSGSIYYSDGKATGKTKWLEIGGQVYDVGIGGGWAWIVTTGKDSGGRQVYRGRDQGGGDFDFQRVRGGMVHIDVDPKGNAWGVNDQNDVFQFVDGNWRRHSGKKATDIGVGGDGTVWIVGTDFVAGRGGATLHRRDPRTRRWVKDSRRLRTITVGPGGQPAGVNSSNQIWDKSARAPNPSEPETEPETEPGPNGEVVEKPKPQQEMRGRVVARHSGDWFRFPGLAQDMGLGAKGALWVVGTDRFAYRWNAGKKSWERVGERQDFIHIDAASDGGALAVTTGGAVYFAGRNAGKATRWTRVADNARDIGIGGRWAWITRRVGNSGQVWRAAYDGSGRFRWRRAPGSVPASLAHIDGDPNGNAWGVSDTNQIYRFDGEKWRKQPGEATDIGIGADNTVWIVGTDIVDRLGGGWLYQFDARARKWIKGSRRLRTVTAGRGGNPAGTEHDHEIWVRNYGDAGIARRTNLALRKSASQSPQRRGRGRAARAVDGNTDGKFRNGSVTDIRPGDGPAWLMIDLGAIYKIDSVRVHNRTDCCTSRLNRAIVEISNNGDWEAADTTFSGTIKKAQPYADFAVGKTGRYVRVRQTSRQILGIAEVEVFGLPTPVTAVSSIKPKTDSKKSAIRYPQGWKQLAGSALDMGLSGKGHMWVIGTDKFAYRWDVATKKWLRHGKRQDFARIDAADDGSALAVSDKGGLFYSNGKDSKKAKWTRVAGKTRDVGIGGGWAWIVSTGRTKGGGVIARARYGKAGKFRWQRVAGRLVRIDGGPNGEAWGVDDKGDVYRRTRGKLRKQAGRQATDIGVGSKGTVWVVGKDVDKAAGGGRLYRRDAITKAWATDNARLQTVSVGQDEQPAGVNAANEMWSRGDASGAGPLDIAGGPKDPKEGKSAQVLALEGMRAALPQPLKALALEGAKTENGYTSGSVTLNGNPAVVVIYTPEGKTKPNVVIWHKRFKFSDYMPDAGGTPLDNVGTLTGTSFWIVPAGNENTRLPAEVIAHLNDLSAGEGKPFPHNHSLKAGVNLLATFESAQMPGMTQVAKLFGRQPKDFYLRGTVDRSIFKKVKQTTVKPTPSSDPKAMAKLIAVYGDVFLNNLVLEGEKLPEFKTGPLTYTDAKYEVSGEAGAIQVGFEVSMEMDVAPPDDSGEPAAKVQFEGIRVDYDQGEKTVTLTGDVDASAAGKLVSYRGLTIETLSFEGVKSEDAALSVTLDGTGKLKSKAIDFEIVLEERNDKYEATLKLKGDWTLAEILDHVFKRGSPPGSEKIVLEDLETSTSGDYLAGTVSLAGEDVRVSLLKPENQNVMVAIEHRALELANYLPQLADTPVKKLGLGRSIFIVVGDLKNPNGSDLLGPTLEITKADKDKFLPSYIVKKLELLENEATSTIAGKSIYPLTLRADGTTIVALYKTSNDQIATEGDSKKVIDALGIKDDTYVLKGFINKDMVRAARYAKKQAGSAPGGSIVRTALPLLNGLDIGFPIPAFQPPKTKGLITFSKSKFRLKVVDGELETFVSSGMSVALPGANKTDVKAMDMIGKVKPVLKDQLEVEFAATTQLADAQVEETPFVRLKALNDPDAEEAVSGSVPTTETSQGWKPAFGVPFLTVEQMSIGGSFTGSGATGPVLFNVGIQSIVEDQTPGQRLVLKGELVITDNKITDMVLEIPGSVKIGALPGVNKVPGINEFTFSDVKLSRYELAGQVAGRGATMEGVLSRSPDSSDYALYLGAKDTNLGVFSSKVPARLRAFPIQSGVMVGSNQPTATELKVADLPERAQALFTSIVAEDAEITIVNGLSIFTKLEPGKLSDKGPEGRFRKLFVDDFKFTEPLFFEGAIEDSGSGATPKVRLVATIPTYKIPGVSEDILKFEGTRMVLEDLDVLTASIEGEMSLKVQGKTFKLEEGKVSGSVDGADKEVQVTGISSESWEKAFGIPFLTLNRLELDANVKKTASGPDVDWSIKTDSVLNKATADEQAFVANGQLLVESNVVTDVILELPGTVQIKKLPAIKKIPGINQLAYSDVKLSRYEIAATVLWPEKTTGIAGVFLRNKDSVDSVEYTLYAATENAKLSHLSSNIPSSLAEFPIQKGVVVFSNQPEATLKISELPDRVQPLFTGYFTEDKKLSIVNGVSVYTTLDPNKPKPGDPFWDLLFGENAFNLTDAVTFEGSIIKNQPDPNKVRLAATIPTYKIPFISSEILKFENSEIVFSNDDGKTAAIKGEMTLKARNKTHKLDGSVTYVGSDGNKELTIEGRTQGPWSEAFGIPGLALSNVSLQVEKKRGETSSAGLGIKADAAFGGQNPQTEGRLVIADGKLAGASFTLLGTVSMSNVPGIDRIPGLNEFIFNDVVLSRNLIAGSNLIAAKTEWTRVPDKKLDAAFIEKDGTFAMLFNVDSFEIGQLSSGVPSPVSSVTIPKSVIAVSNQEFDALDVAGLPEPVRKTLFDDIIGENTKQRIKITEGVTVFTRLDPTTLLKPLPASVKSALQKSVQVKEPVVVAGTLGGVFGGAASAALYAQIPNAVIPGGDLLKRLLNFRDVTFFIRTVGGATSQIGFSGDMDFKVPHLDNPKETDTLDLAGELYMDLGTAAPGIEIAGKMTGRWANPMGLIDFTFEDTEIKVGVNADSSVDIGLGGQAEFNSSRDGVVYYALDLLVGIIPPIVPNKLAVQFVAKLKSGDQLVDGARIGPMTMMEMADSAFRSIFAGGMSAQVINQIPDASAKRAAEQLRQLVREKSLLTPLKKIPLPLLSVRDPKVYLSTPGAGLPAREGLPQPPFGLGAIMSGHLDFTLLGKSQNLANADMRLTLTDGLRIKAEFPEKNLHVIKAGATLDVQAGLFNLGSASFKMSGNAELFSPLDELGGKASFDLGISQSGPLTNPTTNMNGQAQAGLFSRKVGLAVSPTSIDFYSPPECTSPVSVSAKASYGDFKSFQFQNLIPQVVPRPGEVFNCDPMDLVNWIGNTAKTVGEGIVTGGKIVGEGLAKAGEAAVDTARDALGAAAGAASTAASGLKSAADFISSTIPFKDGLNRARETWGNAVRQVPLLGNALGEFSDEVGGAASTAIRESINAARQAGGVIVGGLKKLNPGSWSLSSPSGGQLEVAGPKYDPALENAIKADPHFQGAPEHVKAHILRATLELGHQLLQEKKDIYFAAQQRQDLEWKRQRQIVKLNELHKEAGKQVWLSGNASNCPHGQYWNNELGRCWLDGYALLRTNRWAGKSSSEEDSPKCMAVDQSGVLWKDWCSKSEASRFRLQAGRDARFKLNKDGTIQTTGGKCLGIREKAGKIGKNPQVLALACSGAKTQKWRFDLEGRIAMEIAGLVNAKGKSVKRLCITQLSKGDLYPNVTDEALHLADCDGVEREKPFDWTPLRGTADYRGRGQLKFPDTARLKIDGSDFCLSVGVAFISQPTFLPCDDRNARQLFAFAFVDEKYFTIASRSAGTCLDARDIVERRGTRLMNMPCHHGETQQFFLASTSYGKLRIGNRKTDQCVSSSNTSNATFASRHGSTLISAHRYAGLISASCNNHNTTHLRMTAVNDITKINMDKSAPRPSSTEKADQVRADHLYKTFYFHPAEHPTNRIRAQHLDYFGFTWRKVFVAWTSNSSHPDEQSHSKFQMVPGLTGGAGTVSLKSKARSGPPGSLPHKDHYLEFRNRSEFVVDKIKLDDRFIKAATFKIRNGFNNKPGHITLESVAYPGTYLVYFPGGSQGGNIYMVPGSNPNFSPAAASFVAVPTN